jgi:hypothetical protein
MYVPDRILVVGKSQVFHYTLVNLYSLFLTSHAKHLNSSGQEQHIGTKAHPRELQLENAAMPPDPGFIRVQVCIFFYIATYPY